MKISRASSFSVRFHASELSDRRYCTKCGGHVMIDHLALGLADIRVPLSNFTFKPTVHLNYAETILPMRDGLPKMKDFPAAIGGSGETLPE